MTQSKSKLGTKISHYMGEAIDHFALIKEGDRILVCLSGGKDSWGMLWALEEMRKKTRVKFTLRVITLDQGQPGFDATALKERLDAMKVDYVVLHKDTYKIVKEKIPEGKTYCSLCSRLRRGILYQYARDHGFNKIALGHHRDDLITTLLMSIFFSGVIKSMPPKLLNDAKDLIVIRPLCYVQEQDLKAFAIEQNFPIIPCSLCGSQENLQRGAIKSLIHKVSETNPKIPSNMLHAISAISPSQLMDKNHWPFKDLEKQMVSFQKIDTDYPDDNDAAF